MAQQPTVDDLRVKLCYICREEECHDSRPDPPPVWTHPCKCTLIAHESCLLHWIKTQQRDFGRTRGDLKCPQCGDRYEFEGYNPLALRILNRVHSFLSHSGRVILLFSLGTVVVSFGAGVYMTSASYGAFAVREFLGPDMFRALLTSDPTRWPWHAWINLPLIPFSLIASRTPLVLWTTSPLVPLLFPWPSTPPIAAAAAAAAAGRSLRLARSARRSPLWPPPPALVCALFPILRTLYMRLRDRIIRAAVEDILGPELLLRRREQRRQEQRQRRNQLERLEQEQPPQQQVQQQPPAPAGGGGHRIHIHIADQFALEITHFIFGRGARAADVPGPAPAGPVNGVAGPGPQPPQQPAREQPPPVNEEPQQQPPQELHRQEGEQEQAQQQEPEQAEQRQQAQQMQEQQEQQAPPPAPGAQDENEDGAVAARAIRLTGASVGRLIGGALLMPTIARVMGELLLRISHVVPLVRIIIAPRQPPILPVPVAAPVGALLGLWGTWGARLPILRHFVTAPRAVVPPAVAPAGEGWQGALGTTLLGGFFATSYEWAKSDPVWWRNALGLGIFLVAKDGLKLLHLRLAKRELEERHIKNKSFAGVDLSGLDLIERQA